MPTRCLMSACFLMPPVFSCPLFSLADSFSHVLVSTPFSHTHSFSFADSFSRIHFFFSCPLLFLFLMPTLQEEQEEEEQISDEDDDEEFKAAANPKNLPLGWDGKPIPFWLYKVRLASSAFVHLSLLMLLDASFNIFGCIVFCTY